MVQAPRSWSADISNCEMVFIDVDMNQTFIEKRNPEQQQSDGQDGEDSSKNKFLEVIYVADQHAIELYGLIELPEMLLSVANIVSISNLHQVVECSRTAKAALKLIN